MAVLDLHASKRTFASPGVTLPSKRRYVAYFAAKVARGLEYSPVKLLLEAVVLRPPPATGAGAPDGHPEVSNSCWAVQCNAHPFIQTKTLKVLIPRSC